MVRKKKKPISESTPFFGNTLEFWKLQNVSSIRWIDIYSDYKKLGLFGEAEGTGINWKSSKLKF